MLSALSNTRVGQITKVRRFVGDESYFVREHLSTRLHIMVEDLRNQVFSLTDNLAINYIFDHSHDIAEIDPALVKVTLVKRADELKRYWLDGVSRMVSEICDYAKVSTYARDSDFVFSAPIAQLFQNEWFSVYDFTKVNNALQQARLNRAIRANKIAASWNNTGVNSVRSGIFGSSDACSVDVSTDNDDYPTVVSSDEVRDTIKYFCKYSVRVISDDPLRLKHVCDVLELLLHELGIVRCDNPVRVYESPNRDNYSSYRRLEYIVANVISKSWRYKPTEVYDIDYTAAIASKSYVAVLGRFKILRNRFQRANYRAALDAAALEIYNTQYGSSDGCSPGGEPMSKVESDYCTLESLCIKLTAATEKLHAAVAFKEKYEKAQDKAGMEQAAVAIFGNAAKNVGQEGFMESALAYIKMLWQQVMNFVRSIWVRFSAIFTTRSGELRKVLSYLETYRNSANAESTFKERLKFEQYKICSIATFTAELQLIQEMLRFFPNFGDHLVDDPTLSNTLIGKLLATSGVTFDGDHQLLKNGKPLQDGATVDKIADALSFNLTNPALLIKGKDGDSGSADWTLTAYIDATRRTMLVCDEVARLNRSAMERSVDAYKEYILKRYEETQDAHYVNRSNNILNLISGMTRFAVNGANQLTNMLIDGVHSLQAADGV